MPFWQFFGCYNVKELRFAGTLVDSARLVLRERVLAPPPAGTRKTRNCSINAPSVRFAGRDGHAYRVG
jgi:hypothetical protein